MPDGEGDGGVVGVADSTSDVDLGISLHESPVPSVRFALLSENALIFNLEHSVGIPWTHAEPRPMCLAGRP